MRALFLLLSANRQLKRWSSRSRIARAAARRFVAGDSIEQTIAAIRTLNQRGVKATLDHLGENAETESQAIAAADGYMMALDCIARTGVQSHLSIKPTQLGLDLGAAFCRANLERVASRASEIGTFVRLDMESSAYTDRTFEVLHGLRTAYDNVGVVVQAYLLRSRADVLGLIDAGIPVRLCKGAYQEPASVAYRTKSDICQSMIDLMQLLLGEKARHRGARLALATHDEKLIEATKAFADAHDIPRHAYEFQMLYGIRPALLQQLADAGFEVRVYVPYGTEWYPYVMRRLAERPATAWFLLRNLFTR
jgi:proline dehydrogenase